VKLRAPFDQPRTLEKLRPLYEAQRALVLPGACEPKPPDAIFKPFFLAHLGRYAVAELPAQPELQLLAEAVTGASLKPLWTRLFRLRPGSYSLFADDARTRAQTRVEVVCDLSENAAGPQCFYGPLVIPQLPGLVAVVERTPEIFRRDRYLTQGAAKILRLRAAFTI
jgi:hypothetical protein